PVRVRRSMPPYIPCRIDRVAEPRTRSETAEALDLLLDKVWYRVLPLSGAAMVYSERLLLFADILGRSEGPFTAVRLPAVCLAEVRRDRGLFLPPSVPSLDPLPQQFQMIFIGHREEPSFRCGSPLPAAHGTPR